MNKSKNNFKIGTIINNLEIISEPFKKGKTNHKWYKVRCTNCNSEMDTSTHFSLNCVHLCKKCQNYFTSRSRSVKYCVGKILAWFYNDLKRGAKVRNLEFLLTKEDLSSIFEKQEYNCYYSGIQLEICLYHHKNRSEGRINTTASIDRLDSTKGYTVDNIVFCHKKINIMKGAILEREFVDICRLISNNTNKKDNTEPSISNGYLERYLISKSRYEGVTTTRLINPKNNNSHEHPDLQK